MKKLGPFELPILGSGPRFGKNPLKFFSELHDEFGPCARYHIMGTEFVAVFDPKLIEQVLVKNGSNYVKSVFFREHWKPFFGRGVIVSEGEDWKSGRKALQPFMSKDKLDKYFDLMRLEVENYAQTLKVGEVTNISRDMMRLMLFSLVKILFHSELDDKKIEKFGHLFDEVVDYFAYTLSPAGLFLQKLPSTRKKKFQQTIAELETLVAELLAKDNDPEDFNMFAALKRARDEHGQPMSHSLIRDNVLNFFIAGHETSSLTISYALFLLSQHPEVMKKLQKEIDDVIGERRVEFSDIEKLHYTRNVLNEAMRLYPPAALMGREALGVDKIGDIPVKKGTNVMIPIFVLHRREDLFKDALKFDPSRWESYDFHDHKNHFIPFGVGQRVCMGANFAMMEMTCVLAVLLQKFNFELKSKKKPKLVLSITMRPKKDIRMKVTSR